MSALGSQRAAAAQCALSDRLAAGSFPPWPLRMRMRVARLRLPLAGRMLSLDGCAMHHSQTHLRRSAAWPAADQLCAGR